MAEVETAYDLFKAFLSEEDTKALLADPDGGAIPPFAFENDGTEPPSPPKPWVKMMVTGQLYGQESIGAENHADNEWDETGKLVLSVMVRSGSGGKRSHNLARQLARLFRGRMLGPIECMDAFIGEGGGAEAQNGNWYQRNVVIEWRWMEVT